jgi:predicted transcriptional regulator
MNRDTDKNAVVDVAKIVSNETRLSFKQAVALLMREILDKKDKKIAEVLEVSPSSTSSYVSACRSKFASVDEEINELEQRIEEWEKTKQLESILASIDTSSPREALSVFSETVENELVDDEDVTYLMRYVDKDGQEQVQSIRTHPKNVDAVDNGVEVTRYKRISSVDEVFE